MERRITTGEILENQIDQILREQKKEENFKNKTPKVGPRLQLIHYIFDLNWELEEAVEKILENFTSLEREHVLHWYYDEKNIRERGNSDEGR